METEPHRNTQNINILPKTQQTKRNTFLFVQILNKYILFKSYRFKNKRLMLVFMALFILLWATKPNLFMIRYLPLQYAANDSLHSCIASMCVADPIKLPLLAFFCTKQFNV